MSAWVRPVLRLGMLLIIGLSCALLIWPATWLMRLSPPGAFVQVVAAQGSIWSGQAMLSVGQVGYARSLASMVQWQTAWEPWPEVTLRHPWLSHPVTLRPHWRGVAVSAATVQIPASLLSSLDARVAALELGGQIALQWPASIVPWSDWASSDMQWTMQWTHASTALSHVSPLGSYRLTFSPEVADRFTVELSTITGPVMASGTGSFSMQQGLALTGQLTLDPLTTGTDKASLNELLALMGSNQQGQIVLRVP